MPKSQNSSDVQVKRPGPNDEGYMWVDFTRNDPAVDLPMDTDSFRPSVALFACVDPTTEDYANLNADLAIEIPTFAFPWPVVTEELPWVVGMIIDPKHVINTDQFFAVAQNSDGTPRYNRFEALPTWWDQVVKVVEDSVAIKLITPTFDDVELEDSEESDTGGETAAEEAAAE